MAKKNQYSAPGFTVDEIGFIQLASAKVLTAVARGEIDLNRIAGEELAARGLGLHGEWVGFQRAKIICNTRTKTYPMTLADGRRVRVTVPID